MIYRSIFPRDLFAEFERMQNELDRAAGYSPTIRGVARRYPAMNVGSTPASVEVYAFAPGLDPASLDVQIEKGVLTISGERAEEPAPAQAMVHIDERFSGRFRRVVSLPEDVDPSAVEARYRDGVLHVRIPRRELTQPRRITIQ
ncbi:Hsp20/alpha crystallin family protein [Candidatus Macondimonas diazotrophica]|jgi:HSP20 family protein|uniref:Hsp20/alpha crystallin family protein n=1 Tax=Candidatus Macondimonas diazotrophica TaxID=2305248 RepID=A0A4Z0F6J1_9GAMM|nr:Hsp20/alpha crystallin family protein [Candidatus Macondimonas diazotrophica]NCU00144.1 Hsp20/alpha crystallin family protein [Candidatus Macondimonas diazotrophica]TFZ81801.1 Hsp20/alpha crystallin family protein [Candidatus Macondimonas diazotrophica]HBG29336.1 heat-shock protein Hsp20 [Gammaproteobacteria bacterium]HBG51359.1 heat-shock protein Hsp20 [Gammaproteobacteria bacterium]